MLVEKGIKIYCSGAPNDAQDDLKHLLKIDIFLPTKLVLLIITEGKYIFQRFQIPGAYESEHTTVANKVKTRNIRTMAVLQWKHM